MNDKAQSKFLNQHSISSNIELIAAKFRQNKCKWLSLCVYKPTKQNDSVFEEAISAIINEYSAHPTSNYMFKVKNRNTRTRSEICSKLIIKTPERCHWHCSGVIIVNFEHISHLVLVFLLLTLNM